MTENRIPTPPRYESESDIPYNANSFYFEGGHNRNVQTDVFNNKIPKPYLAAIQRKYSGDIKTEIVFSQIPVTELAKKAKESPEKALAILQSCDDELKQISLIKLIGAAKDSVNNLQALQGWYDNIVAWVRKQQNQTQALSAFLKSTAEVYSVYALSNEKIANKLSAIQQRLELMIQELESEDNKESIRKIRNILESRSV